MTHKKSIPYALLHSGNKTRISAYAFCVCKKSFVLQQNVIKFVEEIFIVFKGDILDY
jgi:hypothetical protein